MLKIKITVTEMKNAFNGFIVWTEHGRGKNL